MKNLLLFLTLFAIQKMAAQSLVFAKDLGFQATDLSTAVDSSGAIYLAGTAPSETDVDPGPLEKKLEGPPGKKVGFVCRFSAAGQLDWAVSLANNNDMKVPFLGGDALKMGQNGLIHAVFYANSAMTYYPGGLPAQGNAGYGGSAIVSLNAETGTLVSVFDLYNSQNGSPFLPLQFNDFSVLPDGKIAIVGAFRGLLQPGIGSQATFFLNQTSKLNGYLMVFDPLNISDNKGVSLGAANSDEIFHGVGFGAGGQFVIGGEYYGSFDADPSLNNEEWLYLYNYQGDSDAFVLVLDSAMAFVSVNDRVSYSPIRHKMESAPSGRTAFTIDLSSEIINPGGFDGELAYLGAYQNIATGYADAVKTAADATGFYQMGGKRIVPSSGPSTALQLLFSKCDLTGNEVWKIGIDGASLNFEGTSIAGSLDGKTVAVAGYFDGSVDFDPSTNSNVLTAPSGQKRAFLLKFSDPCPNLRLQFLENTPVTCTENGRVEAGATGGAAPYLFEWAAVPPVFSPVFETSTGGFFGLKLIDSTGCERQTEVFIEQPASLDPTIFDAQAHLFSLSEFRPGFEQILVVTAQNPYCQSKNGEIRLALDPKMTFILAEPTPDYSVADTLVWLFDSLRADVSIFAKVRVQLSATAILGDSVCVRAEVRPSDSKPQNNVFLLKERIIGSFDPNDIAATPAGVCAENAILPNQTMRYRIRFQNTGTASAINVRVLDTLPNNLDLNTLRVIAASHSMGIERPDSSVLAFVFDNINLPDSFSNEATSHGYIVFELAQKPNLPDGERIENRAAIYFDFNAPVITNTVFQTVRAVLPLCPTVSTGDLGVENAAFSVAPNPISEGQPLQILLENRFLGKIKIELLSLDGRILRVFEKEKTAEKQFFEVEKLPAGNAFFVRISDGKRAATRLVFKE